MAVPIKSNNTQQGCNPISSNCVVWQGPNIPCINLCTGDSVSDVIAKMATELCDITSQTDISLLDLSCFNPLYPTPQNFRDVMQIILNKICALENGTTTDGGSTSGCPSDCEITVAPCLQYSDNLGNTVTSLPIRDYVILIGNRICTILTSIANLQTQIDALDVRVTNLENNTGGGSGGSSSFNVTSDCITTGSVSLQEYISLLDAAFCELRANSGTTGQFTSASTAAACVTGNSVQMANPPSPIGLDPLWLPQPTSAYQQIQNLWVAICDIRAGLTNLREQLTACCAPEAACPNNLPIPQIYLNKEQADSYIYFQVGGTAGTSPNSIALPNGEEWVLTRFEGTIIPSATGTIQQVNAAIPNLAFSTTIDYSNAQNGNNRLVTISGINVSIEVQAVGTFYWRNATTNQECSVIAGNTPLLRNTTVISTYPCPSFAGPTPSFTVTIPSACNNPGGAGVTLSMGSVPLLNGLGVSQSSMPVSITYINTAGISTTVQTIFSSSSNSYSVAGVQCGSTMTFNSGNISQGTAVVTCNNSYSATIPADTTP